MYNSRYLIPYTKPYYLHLHLPVVPGELLLKILSARSNGRKKAERIFRTGRTWTVDAHIQAIYIPTAGEVTRLVISPVQVVAAYLASIQQEITHERD